MTLRLAIFDCDGTLIDGQASICEAMEAAFAAHDLPAPPRNEIRRAVGLSLPQAIGRLLPEADRDTRLELTEAYKDAFRGAREEGRIVQPLVPGIAGVLDALDAAGWLMAVATGMSDRGLVHCLAENGLSDRFVSLQTADRHPSKPDPSMIAQVLADTGASAQDAVMIGDTSFDMLMARHAGARGIGVNWGYHAPAELLEAGAGAVAETPQELQELLLG